MAATEIMAVIVAEVIGAAGGLWLVRHAVTAAMRRYGASLILVGITAICSAVLVASDTVLHIAKPKSAAVQWVEQFERAGQMPAGNAYLDTWKAPDGREVATWQRPSENER